LGFFCLGDDDDEDTAESADEAEDEAEELRENEWDELSDGLLVSIFSRDDTELELERLAFGLELAAVFLRVCLASCFS
jgi:hypothetical protein